MRDRWRMLVPLLLGASAAAAAFAHFAIDVAGDYALPRDSFDFIAHDSRNVAALIALAAAAIAVTRALRACCDVAVKNRGRIAGETIGRSAAFGLVLLTAAITVAAVPLMELLDARIDGVAVSGIADAFGGSVVLGAGVALACGAAVAALFAIVAAWIVARRDVIATIVVTLLGIQRTGGCQARRALRDRFAALRSAPVVYSLQWCKRGPPAVALDPWQQFTRYSQGDPRVFSSLARACSVYRLRVRAFGGACRRATIG